MNRDQWLSRIVRPRLFPVKKVVEVGVFRGIYAKQIIHSLKPQTYYGVDNYKVDAQRPPHKNYQTQEQLDQLYLDVQRSLSGHYLLRLNSDEAAIHFVDNSLDFVYIDADHTYESVKRDLLAWYPKVRKGGIFGGHDYIARNKKAGVDFGVIQAVDELFPKVSLTDEEYATWWVVKE